MGKGVETFRSGAIAVDMPGVGLGAAGASGRVESISIDDAGIEQLHRNAIGLPGVLYFCLAGSAPITAMLANVPGVAGQAGAATPLVFLLSGIGLLMLCVSIVGFAQRLSAAGGFYSFVSHGLNRMTAFQAGWLMMGGYCLFEASLLAAFGAFGSATLQYFFQWNVTWWVLALIGGVSVFSLSYFDLKRSVYVMAPLLILEVAVLLILDLVITGQGGAAGQDLSHTFTTAGANLKGVSPGGFGGVGLGMALGIWSWIGFEAGAVYGEESRNPRRAVPIAIFGVVAFLTVLYVWTSYAATIGFGWTHAVDQLAANPSNAFYTLSDRYAGWLHPWMAIAIATSSLACALAFHNGMVRYFYAMGREGILPKVFGKTHPVHRSPHVAIITQSALALGMIFVFGVLLGAAGLDTYNNLAELGTYAFILVYILVNIASMNYFRTQGRGEFNALKHLVAPVLSTLVVLIPIYSFIHPVPAYPLNLFPYIIAAWIVLGVGIAYYLSRNKPNTYLRLGRVVRAD